MRPSSTSRTLRWLCPLLLLFVASCASDDFGGEVVKVEFHYQYPGDIKRDQLPPDLDLEHLPALESWVMITQVWAKKDPPGPSHLAWDPHTEAPTDEQVQRLRAALEVSGIRRLPTVPTTAEIETEEHYWVVLQGKDLYLVRFNPESRDDRDPVVHLKLPKP